MGVAYLSIQEDNDHVNVTHGDVQLVIDKSPWRMQIYHTSNDSEPVLSEATEKDHRLVSKHLLHVISN